MSRLRAVVPHRGQGHPLRGPPVGQVRHRRALLGDRRPLGADPPVVDDLGGDRDPARPEERLRRGRLVLVADALGPGEPLLLPEVAPEQLVAREHVTEQVRCVVDAEGAVAGVQPGQPRHRRDHAVLESRHVAGHQVGAGAEDPLDQCGVPVPRYDVVGVDEAEQVAGGMADTLVAGRAETLVGGVDDEDALVAGRHGLGQVARSVVRAVVDDDDLQPAVPLRQQAVEALHDVRLDVVDRDDDADQRGGPSPHRAYCTHGRRASPPR